MVLLTINNFLCLPLPISFSILSGTSVVLQQAVAMPFDIYSVPVEVKDLQGVGEVQTVKVRVCECVTDTPGEEVCVPLKRSATLGTWGVLAMLLALLLLLLLGKRGWEYTE